MLALAPAVSAAPRQLALDDINNAAFAKPDSKSSQALHIKAQVLLDRANFSPGVIDGRRGENYSNALRAYQEQNGLAATGELDAATFEKLAQGAEPVLIEYTIREADVR